MLFSSTTFIYLFLPVVLFFYYIVLKKSRLLQNVFLLFASLIFYAWGEPKFVFVMIVSIIINWFLGLQISRNINSRIKSRLIIGLDVFINLALLFVFKYLTFTGNMVESVFNIDLPIPEIALPIGISFFTFQAMSYVIDVYRQKGEVQTNILYVGLYISFFPQLIAGPIVRYETVADEIKNRVETKDDFFDGFARFVIGLAKKVLLANQFAVLADAAFDLVSGGRTLSVAFSWLGAIAYTLQIFFDFGGYSDMAIGLGKMFGFHFLENFDYPYISTSITEFWRRWHISLGTWFRDYVYFPLGGSRVGKWRNVLNLFIVWSLTGLWHGANYTFILWGFMYFALLVIEKLTDLHKKEGRVIKALRWVYTIFFVIVGWVIFRAESVSDAFMYLSSMFGMNNELTDEIFTGYFVQYFIVLIFGVILSTPVFRILKNKIKPNMFTDFLSTVTYLILLVLSIASIVSSSYNPFIYFNF